MANVTSIVGTQWYFGLAFNQSDVDSQSPNIPLAAHYAQTILGDSLIGLQMGNEPDLCVTRPNDPASAGADELLLIRQLLGPLEAQRRVQPR